MDNPICGTCLFMCPESEIIMRQKERMVHPLECRPESCREGKKDFVADRHRMVKMFSRSAAGRDLLQRENLRPHPVLKRTINYLLSTGASETRMPWTSVYTFIADRLRSVRQDMTVQQVCPSACISLLEPIVRFYAFSGYKLCEEPLDLFDPRLNADQLNECLKQLLVCYDTKDTEVSSARPQVVIEMSSARLQMEALYGLLHLGNVDTIYRLLSLSILPHSVLDDVLTMSLARYRNDFITVCRTLRRLPPLLASVAARHLPVIRREALKAMNTGYSNKTNLGLYPLDRLRSQLLFRDKDETAEECKHYGLTIADDNVHFYKPTFDTSVKQPSCKRVEFVDEIIDNVLPQDIFLSCGDP